ARYRAVTNAIPAAPPPTMKNAVSTQSSATYARRLTGHRTCPSPGRKEQITNGFAMPTLFGPEVLRPHPGPWGARGVPHLWRRVRLARRGGSQGCEAERLEADTAKTTTRERTMRALQLLSLIAATAAA